MTNARFVGESSESPGHGSSASAWHQQRTAAARTRCQCCQTACLHDQLISEIGCDVSLFIYFFLQQRVYPCGLKRCPLFSSSCDLSVCFYEHNKFLTLSTVSMMMVLA